MYMPYLLSTPRREQVRSLLFFGDSIPLSVSIDVSNKEKSHDGGDLSDVSVFRDNKTERMRTMMGFEGIMSVGNFDLKGLVVEESPNSLIATAKKKIYVPEKKIILMDQMTEHESELFMEVCKHKGGLIV